MQGPPDPLRCCDPSSGGFGSKSAELSRAPTPLGPQAGRISAVPLSPFQGAQALPSRGLGRHVLPSQT